MRKKQVPKRQPTVLRINSNNSGKLTLKNKGQDSDFKKVVFTEILDALEGANGTSVDLFEIKNSYIYITLNKEYWPKALVKSLTYFESIEDYERCGRCKKMLESIKL